MHERGYQYLGPTSIYKLSIPEMARLHKGWRKTKEKEQEAEQAAQGDTDANDYGPTQPRESDWDAYHDFRDRHGIESNGEAAV